MYQAKLAHIFIVLFWIFFSAVFGSLSAGGFSRAWAHSFHPVSDSTENVQTVRVAFFPMPGFHQSRPVTGEPEGLDVDYLNRICQYTRWKIQYIPVNTWEDALQALRSGEVDLVGAAQFTQDRLNDFSYSADSTGRTRAALIALSSREDLIFEDVTSFDGMRVGVVKTWIRRNDFVEYANMHNFKPEIHEFESIITMRYALQTGAIDAMATNVMEAEPNEKRLAEFLPAPFFYIMRKDDKIRKNALDEALTQLHLGNPSLDTFLMEKWYPTLYKTPYSKNQLDYIQRNPEISMSLLRNRPPFSQLLEGELQFKGIVPAVLDLLSKDSGLRFVLSPLIQDGYPADLIAEGKAGAVAGVARFDAQLDDPRVTVTDSFFASPLALMGTKGNPFSASASSIVAMPKGFLGGKAYIAKSFPSFTVLEVPGNGIASLDAVRTGRADYALVNVLAVGEILHSPRYAKLAAVPGVSTTERLGLLLSGNADPLLLSILNKAIRRLDTADLQRIMADHSLSDSYTPTLEDFFLQYRTALLFSVPLLCMAAFILFSRSAMQAHAGRVACKSAATLANIAHTINDGVITLNPAADCTITLADAKFWALAGVSTETSSTSGRSFLRFLSDKDVGPFIAAVQESTQNGRPIRMELRICHVSGRLLPVLLRGAAGVDEFGTSFVYCALLNMAEQRELVERLETENECFRILAEQGACGR